MASRFAEIKRESAVGSLCTKRLCDFEETDPYYFVIKENGEIITEGDIVLVKFKLDPSYLYRKIKSFSKDVNTLIAIVEH